MAFYAGFVSLTFLFYFLWTALKEPEGWIVLVASIIMAGFSYAIAMLLQSFGCLG